MGYRRLMIESPVSLSVRNAQMVVQTEEKTASFPLEDIDAVLIDNPQVRWTVSTVSALAENGCAVYLCDAKHMPIVTEKQYESIELLLGKLTVAEETPPTETLTLF
jgi:CRISPR/Cas system-associated endonuclease Cas1